MIRRATGIAASPGRMAVGLAFALVLAAGLIGRASWQPSEPAQGIVPGRCATASPELERLPPVAVPPDVIHPHSGDILAPGAIAQSEWVEDGSPVLACLFEDTPSLGLGTTEPSQSVPVIEPAASDSWGDFWHWQVLPDGLIYDSYMAGVKEPRIAATWLHEKNQGWIWDVALGGRVGLLRYGTADDFRPEGWQADIEGAVFPRLSIRESFDLAAADFRYGLPITYGRGRYQTKLAYCHVSSHLGDEFMLRHPAVPRINYRRDEIVWGHSYYLTDELRLYGEVAYALYVDDGAEPWEFQFGVDYSPAPPTGLRPVPFLAINGHLRQEVDFGGNLSLQVGWLWRGASDHVLRMGMQYYAGMSDQYEFFDQYEDKIGLGFWYDY